MNRFRRLWQGGKRALTVRTRRRLAPPLDRFATIRDPWRSPALLDPSSAPAICNICGWSGGTFLGGYHSELAHCPGCGSIARDRFLFFCFVRRMSPARYRVLETSPRLGKPYRQAMARWFDYRASDFDQRAHRTGLSLDLEDIALPGGCLDVVLTPHVLEHVRSTDQALRELHRVLAPSGRMYLQVPVQQGRTAPPPTPELHGDETPVHWRFGIDLTGRLRRAGFRATLLCTAGFRDLVAAGAKDWPDPPSAEFDVESLLDEADAQDLVAVADREWTRLLAFHPTYMFLTWEAIKEA